MTKDEALKLALEYVELVPDDRYNAEHIDREALVTAIREALAQPEQERYWERIARIKEEMLKVSYEENRLLKDDSPQRKPLTDEEIFSCENSVPDETVTDRDWCIYFARAIEDAHGIKGGI